MATILNRADTECMGYVRRGPAQHLVWNARVGSAAMTERRRRRHQDVASQAGVPCSGVCFMLPDNLLQGPASRMKSLSVSLPQMLGETALCHVFSKAHTILF